MKKIPWYIVYGLSFIVFAFSFAVLPYTINHSPFTILADEVEELQKQINDLNKQLDDSKKATKPLEGQLYSLKKQLAAIQANLQGLSAKIVVKEKELDIRTEKLAQQQALLEIRVRSYYIRSFLTDPLVVILSSGDAANLFRELSYRTATTKEDKRVISSITGEVSDLLTQKEKLEKDKKGLAVLQTQVDRNAAFVGGEVKKAQSYQTTLSSQIAQLSVKQQQIIAQKLGSLNLPASLGSGPLHCTDDRKLNPGFSPAFAFYTFGIPHRVGMNQYGALGRAKAGQSSEDILKSYFQNFEFVSGKEGETVVVNGKNEFGQSFENESMNIEEYLKHLYEMPSSWPQAALQAQAIGARSYALRVQQEKGSLRPSQADQVVKKELNAQSWIDAVEATKGKIMAQGGQPVKGWFASTSGGYTFTSADVWGGNTSYTKRSRDAEGDISSFSDLFSKAYDKDSSCFYSAQGYRNEYGKSAWIKSSEVADIANVILLARADSSVKEHLYQPDKPNPSGTDTWDAEKVKQELRNKGVSPFDSVSDISVSADFGSGTTNNITISGSGKTESFPGNEFKSWFNLRAPANIQIVGPLFNIEKK